MKRIASFLGVLFLLLVLALPLRAGGWAVLTLETLPTEVAAERPLTIRFSVRQHGQHLMTDLSPTITAVHAATQDSFVVEVSPAAKDGVYTAVLTFPRRGQWDWSINAFGYDHVMPTLAVQSETVNSDLTDDGRVPIAVPMALSAAGLLGVIGSLLAWRRQRSGRRLALAFAAVFIAAVGWWAQAAAPEPMAAQKATAALHPAIASAQMGEALFVAKGCTNCHRHDGVTMADNMAEIGPDLTHYVGNPLFLQRWLADPSALKSDAMMPDLGLNEEEIDILAAWLVKTP